MTTETTIAAPVAADTTKPAKAPRKTRVAKGEVPETDKAPAKAKAAKKGGKKAKSPKAGQVRTIKRDPKAKLIKRIGDKEHKVDLSRYKSVISASGNSSLDNGDDVAAMLRGKSLDEVYETASKICEVPRAELHRLYDHLNPGMQRMNLGNKLRGAMRESDEG